MRETKLIKLLSVSLVIAFLFSSAYAFSFNPLSWFKPKKTLHKSKNGSYIVDEKGLFAVVPGGTCSSDEDCDDYSDGTCYNCNYYYDGWCSSGDCSYSRAEKDSSKCCDQPQPCDDVCTEGDQRCYGNVWVEECQDWDGDGCTEGWAEINDCSGGCQNAQCVETQDSDSDGVIDSNDACPSTYGEKNNGCPYEDSDSDGIIDSNDNCPKTAGESEYGCPVQENVPDRLDIKMNVDWETSTYANDDGYFLEREITYAGVKCKKPGGTWSIIPDWLGSNLAQFFGGKFLIKDNYWFEIVEQGAQLRKSGVSSITNEVNPKQFLGYRLTCPEDVQLHGSSCYYEKKPEEPVYNVSTSYTFNSVPTEKLGEFTEINMHGNTTVNAKLGVLPTQIPPKPLFFGDIYAKAKAQGNVNDLCKVALASVEGQSTAPTIDGQGEQQDSICDEVTTITTSTGEKVQVCVEGIGNLTASDGECPPYTYFDPDTDSCKEVDTGCQENSECDQYEYPPDDPYVDYGCRGGKCVPIKAYNRVDLEFNATKAYEEKYGEYGFKNFFEGLNNFMGSIPWMGIAAFIILVLGLILAIIISLHFM